MEHLNHENDHGGERREFTIKIAVNGVADEWHHHRITYEEVVALAFPTGPTGGDVRYSVSWTKPDGQEGSLRPGHSIDVVKDMEFDVRNTDKS
ncbi:Multiubiquitin [Bradyrhizobium erythrophlei]|uniref:Multiubiquitin n=1 Tax=Bradyrhizobium erythrophlei TaxID=1437360 RepID=A0A1M5YP84_9BRAD|nr:Multiubiquitin [Bradyrhizobium erythrophlei]